MKAFTYFIPRVRYEIVDRDLPGDFGRLIELQEQDQVPSDAQVNEALRKTESLTLET